MTVALPLEIASDHPSFPGHFPRRAVVPGVVLLDLCLRALAAHAPAAASTRWTIDNAKFLSPVAPGDALALTCDAPANAPSGRVSLRVTAGAEGRVAMTASLSRVEREER